MHACTSFFCLFSIPSSRSLAPEQSLGTDIPRILRSTKNFRSIEAFLLLLVLTFLPATRALTQSYPVVDAFSGSGALSSAWTNTTSSDQGYVALVQNVGTVGPTVSGQQGLAIYTGTTFTNDQYAEATFVNHSSASGSTGVCVRMNTAGSGVCYLADYGFMFLLANGAGTGPISTDCPIPSSGDTIQLLVVGTIFTCKDVTTGASDTATDATYASGSPAILVDQRQSTVYALANFQADCARTCGASSDPNTISLGSFSNTNLNPGFDNTAASYLPGSSTSNSFSAATFNLSSGTGWHDPLGSSSYISFRSDTGPTESYYPPNGDYFYTTTFTTGANFSPASAVGTLTVLADDTVAVYLNGVLIRDAAGPMGPGNSYTNCSDTVPNCTTPLTFSFTGIATGQNVLTFDVKQVNSFSEGLDFVGTIALNSAVTVTPNNVQLYAGQTQQFQANTGVTWSVAGSGTISSTGLYTAPVTIASQQTVTVTATSQADTTETASATITLEPPIVVTVSPSTTTLNAGQTQQFASTVANSTNTGVTWTISPGGTGTISAVGLYTAPATVTTQQTVVVTATSQADATKSASATITLVPSLTQCQSGSNYSYRRAVVIDHTQVARTDQMNFPLLFDTTDPGFATVASGGHVSNQNGYDIIFSTDPNGLTRLDHEIETYNPVTGQIIAWVRVPILSHTTDTVVYVLYGNPNIATSQQNAAGVWDHNYLSVLHLDEISGTTVFDSTANQNNGTKVSATSPTATSSGEIAGAQSFDGLSDAIALPGSMTQGLSVFSVGFWTKSTDMRLGLEPAFVGQTAYTTEFGIMTSVGNLGMFSSLGNDGAQSSLLTGHLISDNNWHHVAAVNDGSIIRLYLDGGDTGQTLSSGTALDGWNWDIGAESSFGPADNHQGSLDEFRFSNSARSADWIATEYNNQSSPSAFYTLYSENGGTVVPSAVSLHSSDFQQFMVPGMCDPAAVVWSMSSGAPGTLTASGFYTAPSGIDTQQTVTITAITLGASSQSFSATVTLLPPVSLSVTPPNSVLYGGQTQQFAANLSNTSNTAVKWTISPAVGTINTSGLYTAPATIATPQSVTITATSYADLSQTATATLTLMPPVSISVIPATSIMFAGRTQQFTASVINTNNTAVTWTISPTGVGTISAAGLYTAPSTIATQQVVTISATSQADITQSASATVTLSTLPCASSGYGYQSAIVIDHTKVAGSDQTDFPVLISGTYPVLATIANGGQVQNGYDIIFTSDASGQNLLDFEIDNYDPATGASAFWVRVPTLSHTADTTIYMWYGNPNITGTQENKAGVWRNRYLSVYHFGNGPTVGLSDSGISGYDLGGSASTVPGVIGGAAGFNGSSLTHESVPAYPSGDSAVTLEAWVQQPANPAAADVLGYGSNSATGSRISLVPSGTSLALGFNNLTFISGGLALDTNWHHFVAVYGGGVLSTATDQLYLDGVPLSTSTDGGTPDIATDELKIGGVPTIDYCCTFTGSVDEVRVSSGVRTAGWVTTEYNNVSSPSTFYSITPVNSYTISPTVIGLYGSQSQQFAVTNGCNTSSTWSIPAGAPGMLTTNGLYTAPAIITAQQTVTVTATSQTDSTKSVAATVTLMAPVTVSVTPTNSTLADNQTQQFTANVVNSSNQAVIWTISPTGAGTINADGIYTAPATISVQQTISITATSVADSTQSASAMITLSPTQCSSSGYGYQRAIVIDHTKVPNTDQTNFPFLFNSTDPDLATIVNGGHVTDFNGNDIIFSTDPNGLSKLDHELVQYNPVTGKVIAWVRVPTLSHTADTILYVFYGNSSITTAQQNPTGVWDSNYQAVYHLLNTATGLATDSTANDNNGTPTSVAPVSGLIDGAAAFDGASSYIQVPSTDFPSFPTGVYADQGLSQTINTTSFSASFGAWFKTTSAGGILTQVPNQICVGGILGCAFTVNTEPGAYDPAGWNAMLYVDDNGRLEGGGITTTTAYNDNKWHFAVVTYANNGTETLYVDGLNLGSTQQQITGYSPSYSYFVGTAYTFLFSEGNWDWLYFNGDLDEVSVSNTVRSGDWIQTEYNNQGSPSTFYRFYPPNTAQVAPFAVGLYGSQSQQFAAVGTCSGPAIWTMSSGAQGALTSSGLYTAPANVTAQQTVTVTATSQASGATIGSAVVTLLPPPAPITLSAATPPPYTIGASQGFVATLKDQYGVPEPGVAVTFTVAGANNNIGTSISDGTGIASYTYSGANSGSDSIQATAVVNGQLLTSNAFSASWIIPVGQNPVQSVTLMGQPTLGLGGLVGAFTDNNGTVIEPIAIGATSKTFVVPAGATQLQLGVDDDYFPDNGGPGFVVAVNGTSVTVPSTAMPWSWVRGGLNNNYQYGLNDGTSPIVAATSLTHGESVRIAVQSGTTSANFPVRPLVNADGDPKWITGVRIWQGAYYPTLYTTASSYPVGQPITFATLVSDSSGTPMSNVPVSLYIAGANQGQYQATTDSTGIATFVYSGLNAGSDILQAQAAPSGGGTLESSQTNVTWVNYPNPPPVGSLTLTMFAFVNNLQDYTVLATDATGSPVPNASIGLYVSGVDNFQLDGITDETGHASFDYYHVNAGTYNVVAVDSVGRNVVFSNTVSGLWTPPPSTSSDFSNQITIGISAQNTVTLPNTLQLNGTVTDNVGITPTIAWSQVSGPGTVTFANPQQAVTTASFSEAGNYVLQLSGSDSGVSDSAQFQVKVNPVPVPETPQGRIGSPLYGSTVSGVVPITVAPGVNLQSGTLIYYPANNINNVTVLNANTTGSSQIGVLDTTTLINGSYWIQLQSTQTNGQSEYDLVLLTVAGNYKPGRVTTTVTDLVVPATGLAISIQRNYDSLNAAISSDFGYGWSLGITTNLTVSPQGDVTFTLGGQRRTFYFQPQPIGFPFDEFQAAFTPEPGLHGTLTDSAQGCPLDVVALDGSLWVCGNAGGGGVYNPPGYIYTDPSGTKYTINANGTLQSVVDRTGNALTVTSSGITSSTGLSVPFVRDSSGRITQITDPQGNKYQYAYDNAGNLASVTYPNITQPSTYTYDTNHLYIGGTDARGNVLPSTQYYPDGRLQSVTDALNETTSYAYDLTTNTTTIAYPPDASGSSGTARMVYDNYGMLLSSTDPLGHTTTNVYDSNHNLTSVTDPLGHTTSYTYDSNGNRTSTTYPQTTPGTNTTSYEQYNQYGEPTSTKDELGNVRTFNYDGNYNPQSVTDTINGSPAVLASFLFNSDGTPQAGTIGYDISINPSKASQFTYDSNGNMASRTDALGRTASYTYDSLGHKIMMIQPLPNSNTSLAAATTTYTYDALGNLTQTAAPLGRTTSSTYDANGNKITDTDPLGHITTYQYDALNRLTTTTYPTQPSTTTTRTYDFRNNVVDETDRAGHITHYAYDLAGRLTSLTMAYGTSNASTTTYAYYNDGRKQSETDALGHATTYTYDAAGRLTALAGVKGNVGYGYDAAGNRTSTTDGDSNTTQYQYDARKRLAKTIYPDTTSVTNGYDGAGNLTSVTDQAGNIVQYTFDAANQLQSVIQVNSPNSSNNTTAYGYDKDGNLTNLTDANGHSTVNSYDLLNNLTSKILPDGSSTETRTYDTAGNLLSLQHFNGKTTTYAYDQLDRLLTRTPDSSYGEPVVSFTYTATGKRASMTDASGTTNYTYDGLDRLTAKATPEGTLNYAYDTAGNVASMSSSNANGVSVGYTYDSLNRLSTVVDNRLGSGQNTTTYTYDAASNLVTASYPDTLQSTFHYDQLNRLTALTTPNSGYLYQLGQTGNRNNATELTGRILNWSYDGIYRLTSETISQDPAGKNGAVGYGLDPVGNRLSTNSTFSGVSSGSYSYHINDLLSIETYDSNGNTLITGGKSFAYDSENRLKSMNAGAVTLLYDGDGNRVARTSSGVTTRYLVDDLNPTGYAQVMEEIVNGSVQREYTYGLQRISQNQVVNSVWTPSFYGYDGMGNVRQLTDSAGVITDKYDYDAFGNKLNFTGTTPNNYLYHGEQYDPDLNLYYLRARYYNPATGRFLSRDPEDGKIGDPRSLHRYLYASGDPVNRIDPSGRADLVEVDLETAEVRFSTHGLAHLVEEGYGNPLTQAEVEAYVEEAVRDFIAEAQGAGTTLGRPFDVMFVMQQLGNVPWAARVFIVSSALIQVSTYFPQGIIP